MNELPLNYTLNNINGLLQSTEFKNKIMNSINILKSIEQITLLTEDIDINNYFNTGLEYSYYMNWLNNTYFDNSNKGYMTDYKLCDFTKLDKLREDIDEWFISHCSKTLEYPLYEKDHLNVSVISKYNIKYTVPFDKYVIFKFNDKYTKGLKLFSTYIYYKKTNKSEIIRFKLNDNYDMLIVIGEYINYHSLMNMKLDYVEAELTMPYIELDCTFSFGLDIGKYSNYVDQLLIKESFDGAATTARTLFKLDKDEMSSETLSVTGFSGSTGFYSVSEKLIINVDKPFNFYVIENKKDIPTIFGNITDL